MMKVIYTDQAKTELNKFHEEQERKLEKIIAEKKVVYGDDALEITVSDIRYAKDKFKISFPLSNRRKKLYLIYKIYSIMGIFIMLLSFLYPYILEMMRENKEQTILLFMGFSMTIIGMLGLFIAKNNQ
ncbi:hypothetical protein [Neisseria subflava]|jgi:hypothetical protein|uniref:hypothetical protein n=1 Tax=Neisseria subflava TaxID=28449 RepID=UPI00131D1CBC|nr:hypothetical protein [Neisseria subflava]